MDGNTGEGGQKGGGCGGSMGSSGTRSHSTKGQEDFMMAHMVEERLLHRTEWTVWRRCCRGWGGEGQSEDPGSNSAQAEVLASSHY